MTHKDVNKVSSNKVLRKQTFTRKRDLDDIAEDLMDYEYEDEMVEFNDNE